VGPGAPTVLICGTPAAVVGDMVTCVGPPDTIAPPGCPTVLIGTGGGGGGGGGAGGAGRAESASGVAGAEAEAEAEQAELEDHFLDVSFTDKGGFPVIGPEYVVRKPDGELLRGPLTGRIKWVGVEQGNYDILIRAIKMAKWSADEAAIGDTVELLVETAGMDSGEKARLEIFVKDANYADRLLTTIESKVDGDEIEEEWEFQIDQPLLDSQDQKMKIGRYSAPYFYFKVTVGGLEQRSRMLKYKDWIDIKAQDDEGNTLANRKYRVRLPNGEIREGTLDDKGEAREEHLPPGRCTIEFLPGEEQSDTQQSS
jgi:hypothetical protein